jgi:hypothetical protein
MNLKIIRSNLSEAVEELQRLVKKGAKEKLSEGEFQVGLCHAYHHLSFAWDIRYRTTQQYASLTEKHFKGMGQVS